MVSLIQELSADAIVQDDLFQDIDRKIIHELAAQLVSEQINLDALMAFIKKRENKYWYPDYKHLYVSLGHAGQLFAQIKRSKIKKSGQLRKLLLGT